MKIVFTENQYNSWFTLEPETPAEVAQLYRMANNSKVEKPQIILFFGGNDREKVYCNVTIKKLSPKSNKVETRVKNY